MFIPLEEHNYSLLICFKLLYSLYFFIIGKCIDVCLDCSIFHNPNCFKVMVIPKHILFKHQPAIELFFSSLISCVYLGLERLMYLLFGYGRFMFMNAQ